MPAMPSRANGVPVTIVLSYLDGVSNWGPRNATGISEFVARESELRLTATGLPRLTGGEEYLVWITNTGTGQRMSLAPFNATPDGRVNLDTALDMTIPDGGWNLMFVTVEQDASHATQPSDRHSLAGRWPVPETGQGRPAELPLTGGGPADGSSRVIPTLVQIVAVGVGIMIALVAGVYYGRRSARRGQQ
jgi:hypothetical protein